MIYPMIYLMIYPMISHYFLVNGLVLTIQNCISPSWQTDAKEIIGKFVSPELQSTPGTQQTLGDVGWILNHPNSEVRQIGCRLHHVTSYTKSLHHPLVGYIICLQSHRGPGWNSQVHIRKSIWLHEPFFKGSTLHLGVVIWIFWCCPEQPLNLTLMKTLGHLTSNIGEIKNTW